MTSTPLSAAPAPAAPSRIAVPRLFQGPAAPLPDVPEPREIRFVEPGIVARLADAFLRRMGVETLVCPVEIRGQKPGTPMPLPVLGAAMGFGDERSQRLLHDHHRRRLLRRRISGVLDTLFQTALLFLFATPYFGLLPGLPDLTFWSGSVVFAVAVWATIVVSGCALLLLLQGIIGRLTGLLVDRYFVESLCATHVLYLLAELYREDVLARAVHRRELVCRFDGLARVTQLLALRYGTGDPAARARLQRHFCEMAAHIVERRVWAVTPVATTLEDLRRDVWELARVFITGTYGEVAWTHDAAGNADQARGGWRRLLRGAGKAAGLLAPLVPIGYLMRNQATQDALGFGSSGDILGLVFLAWLLLAVDSLLQLGVVAGVMGLAKGIKDLK